MNRHQQSGRVSKKLKQLANKRMLEIEKDIAAYKGRCLFVNDNNGGYCNKPVTNNCHIVSEPAVLDGLKDDKTKKVIELQWGVSKWRELLFGSDVEQRAQDTTTFDPSERTTGVVCTGRFACKLRAHDDEFQPIDVADPDFDDPEARFLSGYRLALFLADQPRTAKWLHQKWDRVVMREVKLNRDFRGRDAWREESKKLKREFLRRQSTVKLLGSHWHARKTGGTFDLDVVSAQVLTFRSKLRLAGGVSYGKGTGVTVFPGQGDWHKMGVLYLTSESDLAGQDIECLAGVARASEESDNYGVTMINELMMNGWGTVAVSPESYEALNDQDHFTIQSLVARHSRNMELTKSIDRQPSRGKRRRK